MGDIVLENVNFSYDKDVILEDINFAFSKDDFLTIIGPNGGGKSTLLKLILGLLQPQSGKISTFGKSPKKCKSSLAYVPQNTSVNQIFPITALEVALMGRLDNKIFTRYSKDDYKKAYEALEKVGVRKLHNANINNLSGGQRQRVFIARALCSDAKVILLDEPTASIDTNGQIKIYELLKKLNENLGIIVVSHDVNVSMNFANKVAHVNKTLFMHDISDTKQRQEAIKNIKPIQEHLCSVEIISQTQCHNPACHEEN